MRTQQQSNVKVFICYAREDFEIAARLYQDLQHAGVEPWMDRKNLRPGQKWRAVINQAIRQSAYVIALLSAHSVSKRGFVQKELKEALDVVDELPPFDIFVIPVRVDACEPVDERLQELHWVDLFESYEEGVNLILQVVRPTAAAQVEPPTPALRPSPDRAAEDDLLREKLSRLRQAKIIETDAATLFKLDKQIEAAERQQAQLEEALAGHDRPAQPMKQAQPEPPPAQKQPERKPPAQRPAAQKPSTPPPKANVIHLRSEPLTVSEDEFRKIFQLNENQRPLEYIQNDYEDQGEVVLDRATGLMWQKLESENRMVYDETTAYIDDLNAKKFAGYDNWRLPTIPELMSLLEPDKQSNNLYINPIFATPKEYPWYWSADRRTKGKSSSGSAWRVYFSLGYVTGAASTAATSACEQFVPDNDA